MRLVRVASCGCVIVIASADITTTETAIAQFGGTADEWREMSIHDAADLFVRPCPRWSN